MKADESTAADRAVADMRRGGASSVMRVTAHDSALCGGSLFGKSAKMAMTGYTVMAIFDDVLVSSFFVP